MSTATKVIVIVIAVVLVILFLIGLGIGLYFLFRPSQNNILASNGEACTVDSDCQSNNCSNDTCQQVGVTTGTEGADCNINNPNSACNMGLTCKDGICQDNNCQMNQPGTNPNGQGCSTDKDCQSCNCSSQFCQQQGITTGELGAICSQNNQPTCNTGLTCNTMNVCVQGQDTKLANGQQCTTNNDCQSNNCSGLNGVTTGTLYCQATGLKTGWFNAVCSLAEGGAPCGSGLQCNGTTCQLEPNTLPLGTVCTPNSGTACTLPLECFAAMDVTNVCNYNETIQLGDIFNAKNSGGVCPPGTTMNTTTNNCLANSKQFCFVDNQCTSGTCANVNGAWSFALNTDGASWQALPNTPGPVTKAVVYTPNNTDVVRISVLTGNNTGIFDLNLLNPTSWSKIIDLTPPSNCNINDGGQLTTFAISRDGGTFIVAYGGLTGDFGLPPPQPTMSGLPYTAVMEITGTGTTATCKPFIPSSAYPGYTISNGMILGSLLPLTGGADICPQNPPEPCYGPPIVYIIDMDLDTNNNILFFGTQNPLGENPPPGYPISTGAFYYSISATAGVTNSCATAITSNNSPPLPLNQYNNVYYFPYCDCERGCNYNSSPPLNCSLSSDNGIAPSTVCGNLTNGVQNGLGYVQSAKLMRTFDVEATLANCPFVFNSNIQQTFDAGIAQWPDFWPSEGCTLDDKNITYNTPTVPAILATYAGCISSTETLTIGTCLLNKYNAYQNVTQTTIPYNNYVPNLGAPVIQLETTYIIDFDMNFGSNLSFINVAYFASFAERNRYGIIYIPDITSSSNTLNYNYTVLPGYFPNDGRIALSQNAVYFFGSGACN